MRRSGNGEKYVEKKSRNKLESALQRYKKVGSVGRAEYAASTSAVGGCTRSLPCANESDREEEKHAQKD